MTGLLYDVGGMLRMLETNSINDMLADRPTPTNPTRRGGKDWYGPDGSWWGWKGPLCDNAYGAALAVLRGGVRMNSQDAIDFVVRNTMLNAHNYGIYYSSFGTPPNEGNGYIVRSQPTTTDMQHLAYSASILGMEGKELQLLRRMPGGEFLMPDVYGYDTGSQSRHYSIDYMAEVLVHPATKDHPFLDKEQVIRVLIDWAVTRMQGWDTRTPKRTDRHHYCHYPVRTFAAIFRAFRELYKEQAEQDLANNNMSSSAVKRWAIGRQCWEHALGRIYWSCAADQSREALGRDGSKFRYWSQENPDSPQWHQLNQIETDQAWYKGLRAGAFVEVYLDVDCPPIVRAIISNYIRKEADWFTHSADMLARLPAFDLNSKGDGAGAMSFIQGGLKGTAVSNWITSQTIGDHMTPQEWADAPDSFEYWGRICQNHIEFDNGQFDPYWTGSVGTVERWHYPKRRISSPWPKDRAFGPTMDSPNGLHILGVPDLQMAAAFLTGDVELQAQAEVNLWDSARHQNILGGSSSFRVTKGKVQNTYYNGVQKTRGFQLALLHLGELHKLVYLGDGESPLAPSMTASAMVAADEVNDAPPEIVGS